ncbi:MAG TPA: ATP-binding protein, partial [Gemmatimonadaceae bacterium]|nr:ATP-binding protein [Gemmatimonadaceae bacterium]
YTATYTEPEDERLAMSLGADAFILKPAEPEEFLARIKGVLAGAAGVPVPSRRSVPDDGDLLKVYSQALIRKLEEKSLQLEEANQALLRDVAEREQMAETQKAILDALPAHIALIDAQGVILAVNESWRRFASANVLQTPEFGVGQNYLGVCDRASGDCSNEAAETARGIRQVLAGEIAHFTLEYPCHSPTEQRWFRVMVTPLHPDFRAGAVVMHVDITERRVAQEALQASVREQRELAERLEQQRARLAEAQAVAHVGSWETDLATLDVTWSEETHRIFETDPATFAVTHPQFLEFVHPEDRTMVDTAFRESASIEGEHSIEHRLRLRDGRVKVVQERWRVVHDANGKPVRASGTCQDITERKQIEAQFLRAQRMESLGTLAGGIAHDLNNVLTPIMMAIDLLKSEDTDPAHQEILSSIEVSARQGAHMVQQVLSFARGVEGRRLTVDIRQLLRDVEKIVNDTFLKNIRVRVNSPAHVASVTGDPTQLQQVLLNLCVNARDAMPEGGTLTLSVEELELDEQYAAHEPDVRPGPHVVIRVEDTGMGMPASVIDRIFEPFFTTKETGKGTGLGLSTSLAIVKSHGGFMRVQSTPGAGSTFSVYLPSNEHGASSPPPLPRAELPQGNGELILVVDDEPSVREITRRTLERFGYRVVLASDGAEAVATYAQQQGEIAGVITDMMMPVVDGPAAILALRKINPHLPIVAVSGVGEGAGGTRAVAVEATRRLTKPYTTEALLRTVREALQDGSTIPR